jgi:hypothetical protein
MPLVCIVHFLDERRVRLRADVAPGLLQVHPIELNLRVALAVIRPADLRKMAGDDFRVAAHSRRQRDEAVDVLRRERERLEVLLRDLRLPPDVLRVDERRFA